MIARFRGWTRLIALQLEYSLLERTIEGELIPLALEQGLGVTPWSPLKFGVLSGKYTRTNTGKVDAARGDLARLSLNERSFAVIDMITKIAQEADATPARIALSWVQNRPGVTSTIIGARTMAQLEDNLAALDLRLQPKQLSALDELTAPQLNFPAQFLRNAPMFSSSGTVINGVAAAANPFAPKSEQDRF